MKTIRTTITTLNLKFLIADILEKQRNPASTTFKKMASYKANRPSKNPIHQNKSPKYTESSKPSNHRKKPDKGSSHNIHPEKDKKASKDVETKLKSDPNPKLESFIYVIKNFDLDDSKSSCFISFLNSRNNFENFEIEGGYLAIFNRSKKPLKRSPNRPDLLLYDIGTTNHIVNDKKWFRDDYTLNKS